jgi:transcriptional regulator with XRE-family HTH domain
MTPAELKTYREALGLTVQWLADKAGVSHRSACYWESGKVRVPDDVAKLITSLHDLIYAAADEAIKQVNDLAVVAGIPEQINLLRYKTDDDLHRYRNDFNGLPTTTHAALLNLIARELRLMGINAHIVYFDEAEYLDWLNRRINDESMRSAWAATQP